MDPPAQSLEKFEVRPVAKVATAEAEQAVQAWVAQCQASGSRLSPGQVLLAGGQEFAVVGCVPLSGGAVTPRTDANICSTVVPVLQRVQLTLLDAALPITDQNLDKLYEDFVRPYLVKIRERRRQEGCRHMIVLGQDQVFVATGKEFGVRALDPAGRYGALNETTAVYVSQIETPALAKVHVLPYEDTLPAAYTVDLFKDFLQPFFQAHPFAVYGEGDHFSYRGVRFRIMATDPPGVAARVSNQTVVYCQGDPLRPTIWDLMPPELRQDVMRLPRGLQMLLLNTMVNEEAVRGRLTEVHEVLRPGQGLSAEQISACGRVVAWRASERAGDTQLQCMVCLTEFADGESLRQLSCGHLFHQGCIDEWLHRSAACPICKRPAAGRRTSASSAGNLLENAIVVTADGRRGRVLALDAAALQCEVLLEADGEQLRQRLPLDDLAQSLANVRLVGLQSMEYNGAVGQIVGLDAARGRYQVHLDGNRVLSVRPDNCILPTGTVARVFGLRPDGAGANWNGSFGRVVGFDSARLRHQLAMHPRGQLLSVRPKNLRV